MAKNLGTAQLAAALGMSNASIAMAYKNGKLIRDGDKQFDIELPENMEWINEQVAKGKVFDIAKAYEKANRKFRGRPKKSTKQKPKAPARPKGRPKKEKQYSEPEEESPHTGIIEAGKTTKGQDSWLEKKRSLELKRAKNQVILDELKIQKIKGQLIPYDAVKTVFLFAVETFRSTYLQEVDALSNVFIKRLGGGHKHFVELQKELQEKINDIQKSVKEDLLQGLKGIQAEYKEVRSRGERK